jgi:hypothetical protein
VSTRHVLVVGSRTGFVLSPLLSAATPDRCSSSAAMFGGLSGAVILKTPPVACGRLFAGEILSDPRIGVEGLPA